MFNQWLSSLLSSPVIPFALSLSICVLVLGFTSQNSPLRTLGLIPMLGCMQLALRIIRIKDDTTNQLYMSMLMGSTASMVMQYLDSVLLSRWTYEAQGPTSALGGQTKLRTLSGVSQQEGRRSAGTFFSRLVFGWEESFRARSTRTPWEVKHVPKFFPDRPEMVPTRPQFLYLSARRCLISLFIVDVISFMGRDATLNSVNFAQSRIPFFARLQSVTTEEIVLRVISSVLHWVVFVFLLQALYDIAGFIIIALGFGRIERWPPLFNRWTECWSVRQFWGQVTPTVVTSYISCKTDQLSALSGIRALVKNSWLQPISFPSRYYDCPKERSLQDMSSLVSRLRSQGAFINLEILPVGFRGMKLARQGFSSCKLLGL